MLFYLFFVNTAIMSFLKKARICALGWHGIEGMRCFDIFARHYLLIFKKIKN